ncbi:acyltransferase family protein [Nocardioides sp.]|uniref:acyltransferase family protein n=1 Tax=Nocardioides sp. TaxID=35761 RepID=UPI0026311B87|nr:acyltransferase family protein [Nocardioides sp.]
MTSAPPAASPLPAEPGAERPGPADGTGRPGRIVGLDVLRAVGVTAVIGYHLGVPGLAGGFLGVTLFFVVSGFLITHLLLRERALTGRVDLLAFWRRRARRLFPAAYVVIAACLVWATLTHRELLPRLRPDALAALVYGNNWWMVVRHTSYFDSFGLPSPLTHFWSLAVEEQFYLLWPVVLVGLLVVVGRNARSVLVVGLLGLASLLAVVVGYLAGVSLNRLYLGTDTRAGELLAGATLALALHLAPAALTALVERIVPERVRRLGLRGLFLASLVVFVVLVVTLRETAAPTYLGGLALATVASVGLVASVGAVAVVARLDRGLVGAVGRRSYVLYLWHFPVLVALSSATDYGRFSWTRVVAVVAVTALLAELTHRCIENPVRRAGLRGSLRRLGGRIGSLAPAPRMGAVFGMVAPVAVIALALSGRVDPAPVDHGPTTIQVGPGSALTGHETRPHRSPSPGASGAPHTPHVPHGSSSGGPSPHLSPSHSASLSPGADPSRGTEPSDGTTPSGSPSGVPSGSPSGVPSGGPSGAATPGPLSRPMAGARTVVVGDSLMIDIAPSLERALPGISIDAQIGRQPRTGLQIAGGYPQFNRPGGTYILGIGTNGAIDASALSAFCRTHAEARIVLITPRVARSWESTSVAAIRQAAARYPNVQVVDFHRMAAGHDDWFGPDGVHLTPAGVRAMSSAIVRTGRS